MGRDEVSPWCLAFAGHFVSLLSQSTSGWVKCDERGVFQSWRKEPASQPWGGQVKEH